MFALAGFKRARKGEDFVLISSSREFVQFAVDDETGWLENAFQ
jgi:hypothetical protein